MIVLVGIESTAFPALFWQLPKTVHGEILFDDTVFGSDTVLRNKQQQHDVKQNLSVRAKRGRRDTLLLCARKLDI
jgi:hypothetical protein